MNDFEKFDSIINKFDNLIKQFTEMKAEVEKAREEVGTKVNIVYGYHIEDVERKIYRWYTTNSEILQGSLVLADTKIGNKVVMVTQVIPDMCLEKLERGCGMKVKEIVGVYRLEYL